MADPSKGVFAEAIGLRNDLGPRRSWQDHTMTLRSWPPECFENKRGCRYCGQRNRATFEP